MLKTNATNQNVTLGNADTPDAAVPTNTAAVYVIAPDIYLISSGLNQDTVIFWKET